MRSRSGKGWLLGSTTKLNLGSDVNQELLRSLGLIGGGECHAHFHPHIISLDELHRMQQLEVVVFTDVDYQCREQDDFIFVDTTNGPVTVTLHPADYGQHITVSRIAGTSPVTIAASVGETVNLVPSIIVTSSFTPRRFKGLYKNTNSTSTRQHHVGPMAEVVTRGYLEI
jgi:hypothetical protein